MPDSATSSGSSSDEAELTLDYLLRRMRFKSDFPALSTSVSRVQALSNSDTDSMQSLCDEVLQDVALTQKLLRVVNTAHFRRAGTDPISTVSRAVALNAVVMDYVESAKLRGEGMGWIVFKEIVPNILPPLITEFGLRFCFVFLTIAALSFLGVGVQPPQPSWGLMIKENYNFIITHHAMLALVPGLAIMLLVLAFNLLGNGLRDAVDVKSTPSAP